MLLGLSALEFAKAAEPSILKSKDDYDAFQGSFRC